jgi:hypothetical protein
LNDDWLDDVEINDDWFGGNGINNASIGDDWINDDSIRGDGIGNDRNSNGDGYFGSVKPEDWRKSCCESKTLPPYDVSF